MISRLAIVLLIFWVATVDLSARGPWVTLQGCHYLPKRANDGDSFHVSVNGKEYIFRLYFVDAPETTPEFRDRVEEQAKYFGMTVPQTTQVGEIAKNYTKEKLTAPFVVRTCWEDAMGRSRLQRFYATVQTTNGDLAEQLVENGLARIKGIQADPQGLTFARQEWQKLTRLQVKARNEKVGGWGAASGRMTARATNAESAKGVDPFNAFFHPENAHPAATPDSPVPDPALSTQLVASTSAFDPKVSKLDVNSASEAELENIKGIGPVMAQRIVEARPFKSADDLRNVKGIGDKKYEILRPF